MTRKDVLKTAFSQPDEVHAFVAGLYAGLKRPHRFPAVSDRWTGEAWYWKGGVITAKAVWVLAAVVAAYTRLGF